MHLTYSDCTNAAEWIDRMIISRDKTHVTGSVLIDDKPYVTGTNRNPSWQHVIFEQPYNKGVSQPNIFRNTYNEGFRNKSDPTTLLWGDQAAQLYAYVLVFCILARHTSNSSFVFVPFQEFYNDELLLLVISANPCFRFIT